MKLLNLVAILSILLLLRGKLMPEIVQQEWQVPRDFPTIQAAIAAAHEGDTIFVTPGVYREHLVITKSLTLQGAGPDTVLEGEPSEFEPFLEEEEPKEQPGGVRILVRLAGPQIQGITPIPKTVGQPAIVVQAGQVQIRGLQIRPQGLQVDFPGGESPPPVPRPLRAGVVVEKGAEALMEQVIIRNAHYGVVVKRGASLTLRHSILHNWRLGVQVWGKATVEDSSIHNEDIYESESSESAIYVETGGQAFLRRNRISIFHVSLDPIPAHRIGDFHDGGVAAYGSEIVMDGNQIVGDLHCGIYIFQGKASIRGNLFLYRGGNYSSTGLNIGSAEAAVEGNTIFGLMPHGVGIKIRPEAFVTLQHNRLVGNGIGIEVFGAIAKLVENEVYANKTGVQLTPWTEGEAEYTTAPARVEFVRNRISQNEECGIAAQSSHYVDGREVYEIFKGQLTGEENEVQDNLKADLCPADYPWPAGFRK